MCVVRVVGGRGEEGNATGADSSACVYWGWGWVWVCGEELLELDIFPSRVDVIEVIEVIVALTNGSLGFVLESATPDSISISLSS